MRSSGPGGQNVNKVSTAVQLRFDVRAFAVAAERRRGAADAARRQAADQGRRASSSSRRTHRTQERNRADARERLFDADPRGGGAAGAAPRHQGRPRRSKQQRAGGQEAPRPASRPCGSGKPGSIPNSGGSVGAPAPRGAPLSRRLKSRPPSRIRRSIDARPPAFRNHRQPHRRRRGGRAAGERGQGTGRERARRRRARASTC